MIHESKVSFTKVDSKGNDKVVKQRYLIAEAASLGDAEQQTYDFCDGETALDVIDVKRSKIKEILNKPESANDNIFIAEVADVTLNDEGEEVEILYKVALFAEDLDTAYSKLKKHLEQGYSMTAIGVKKSNFVGIIAD